jgi:hypothetical protein
VVWNKVEDDFEPFCMRLINKAIKCCQRAEDRINPAVVGDVVTKVMHRRGINRRNPDRIDAEPDEIIEPVSNAIEIAYSIAIRILKRPRVDLVNCASLPPMIHYESYVRHLAMAVAALIVEVSFAALGLIPAEHLARVVEAAITWNYTTWFNIVFLALATMLVWRFLRTGGVEMLQMMNRPAESSHAHHAH